MQLREYQKECVSLIDNLEKGSYLVAMATGLGKTVIFSALKRRGRVLIISHREELVTQPLKYYDCSFGIEQGAKTSHGEQVVSASVQSLIKRLDKFSPQEFDTIITDEAHHAAAKSYKKIYAYFKPRLHLGFTATPQRGDKVRLDDIFDKIIFQRDLKWGILNDYLTNIKCLRIAVSWNLKPVKVHMGDFQVNALEKAIDQEGINSEIGNIYARYAKGQTLIFAASVSHAENIAAKIPGAVAVSQKTRDRAQIIADFTAKKIKCLVNCLIFTEGTDLPLIETIIIARPTKNQSLYTQMVGRGLRKAPNKPYLTLIDLVGVTDDLDICTAPSLMGIDMQAIPKSRANLMQGMLLDFNKLADEAADCPENWILNVRAVRLFANDENVDIHNINWTKKPNGDLVYQFTDGERIGIRVMDELGKTKVMYYSYDEEKQKFVYKESGELSLQQALDTAYRHFCYCHEEERPLWDLTNYYSWQYMPATEKQIAYIKSKLTPDEYKSITENNRLSKGDCSQIINALKIKNATPYRLLQLHKAAKLKQAENEAKTNIYKTLPIETHFAGKPSNKYYAIKHIERLVLTDSWDVAGMIISEFEAKGEKCRYKKFPSKKAAIEFLRS